MREVRAKEERHARNENLCTELNLKLKILAESAAPRVVGEHAVARVIDNAVDGVTLEEAGLLASNEVRHCVGVVFRHLMTVVRVEGDESVSVYLCVGGLGYYDPVIVTRESAGGVARLQLLAHGNYELKHAVGHVDDGLGESFIELQLHKLGVTELYSPLVAFLVLAVEVLVDLVAVSLELQVAVLAYKLKIYYGNPSFFARERITLA